MTNLKIFIKQEAKRLNDTVIQLEEPLKLCNCSYMFLKSVSIFWNYNNLYQDIHHYTYDGRKVEFKDGYYTFNILKTEFENIGKIQHEKVKFSGKCTIKSDKTLNLKTFGPILGFPENKVISANTLTESDSTVNINNDLKYINISCNIVDKSKNLVNGKRSDIFAQIPITTEQTLKGSVTNFKYEDNVYGGVKLSNGIFNELIFKVEGNLGSSVTIGNILFEIKIIK